MHDDRDDAAFRRDQLRNSLPDAREVTVECLLLLEPLPMDMQLLCLSSMLAESLRSASSLVVVDRVMASVNEGYAMAQHELGGVVQ